MHYQMMKADNIKYSLEHLQAEKGISPGGMKTDVLVTVCIVAYG